MRPITFIHHLATGQPVDDQLNNNPFFRLLAKRVFPGFKIGEAIAWLVFLVCWPALMASIYFLTGKFDNEAFMSFATYLKVQVVVLGCKAFLLAFFWWLYFVRLQNVSLFKKLLLHFFTAPVFAALGTGVVYIGLTYWLHRPYPPNSILTDIYNLLFFYTSHFALFHAYNFWRSVYQQRLKEQELRNLGFATEIRALKAQIEPHFLFNTLNSISASVPPEQEKTRMLIADLADIFRFALKASEAEMITLEEELQFIKTWLALEKYRLKEKLKVIYEVDSRCLYLLVPPMLLQPIVENALKHGIAQKISGGKVHIHCSLKEGFVQLSISDTGVGYVGELSELKEKGIGLKNIAKRLQLLYNQPLIIERNKEGLTVSFKIPLHEEKDEVQALITQNTTVTHKSLYQTS